MNYFVTFGNSRGRMTGQDYVHAPTIQQARIIARSMCARYEQVLTVEQLPVVEDKDLLDYESIEVI
jgi:hypothetical protein